VKLYEKKAHIMGSKGYYYYYSSSMMILWVMFVAFFIMSMNVKAADPDPVVDFPAGPDAQFALHDIIVNGVVTESAGGTRIALSTDVFPALM
jgi:hypothetical protein